MPTILILFTPIELLGKPTGEMFLRILSNQEPSAICTHCHQEQGKIVGTKHDLQLTDTPFTNALGQHT